MNNNTEINRRKKYNFFYLTIRYPINDELKEFPMIFEGEDCKVHIFTEFLEDKIFNFTLKNKKYNTIKNFHLTYIIRFLNFIFNDSIIAIDNIEDLQIEMIDEFLDRFSQGRLPEDENNEWRSKETVDKANYSISHFVYWLWWKKDSYRKKVFKMKYIKEDNLKSEIIEKHSKNGYSTRKIKKLCYIGNPLISHNKKTRKKVVEAGNYMIEKLIEVAMKNDPLMVFGIILGAYSGLRVGYIVQMSESRINGLERGKEFGAYFDFKSEIILRSDNKMTSSIKKKIDVPVYPGCTKLIYHYYQEHINILKSKGLYPNKYGAIFLTEKGQAMMENTYLKRFDKLNKLVDKVINQEASVGVFDAIREQQILSNNKITPHSLRHYYKQLIEKCEQNPRLVQYYLAHASIDSQDEYVASEATKEGIRKCQNEIYSVIKR